LSNGGKGASTTPATVQFTPDGTRLVVAEADGDALSLFSIGADGKPSEATVFSVPGTTPTGIAFAKDRFLVVAEAAGDRVGEGTVSSLELLPNGFRPISRSLQTTQTATCWVAVDRGGSYAYFANYEDLSLSSFRLGLDGALSLVEARAAELGENGNPTDLAISRDNRWLYVLCDTRNSVIAFGVGNDGALKRVGEFGGAPKGSVGMVAW
jgi:6-phosphogluconolactonase (cycloisomerase 2 family)